MPRVPSSVSVVLGPLLSSAVKVKEEKGRTLLPSNGSPYCRPKAAAATSMRVGDAAGDAVMRLRADRQ